MRKSKIKRFLCALIAALMLSAPMSVSAYMQEISGMFSREETDGSFSLLDGQGNVLEANLTMLSDFSGYPYGIRTDGSKVLFDLDGSILCVASCGYEIVPPAGDVYAVYKPRSEDGKDGEFFLYDYPSRTLLFETVGYIQLYEMQRKDKLFLRRGSKYAVIDRNGNLLTDFIYDSVQKTFNLNYEPFPHSYAIVTQAGKKKYLDIDLNEINLENYNGGRFVTNSYPLQTYNFHGMYKQYYMLESGDKYAIYDMETNKMILPYLFETPHCLTDGKYIVFENKERNKSGITDFEGNILLPLDEKLYRLGGNDTVTYSYTDEEGVNRTRKLHLPDLTEIEAVKKYTDYQSFYEGTPFDKPSEVAGITVVFRDGTCADLGKEGIDRFTEALWNFSCERNVTTLEPQNSFTVDDHYYLLYNADRSRVLTTTSMGGYVAGIYGKYEDADGTKQSCVWYSPARGNGRNSIYTMDRDIIENYTENRRNKTDSDSIVIPTNKCLNLSGSSEWAKSEIEKAAALNLLPMELTFDFAHYKNAVTRLQFCKLAAQLLCVDRNASVGTLEGIPNLLNEYIAENPDTAAEFSDCEDPSVRALAAVGVVNGVGDGLFAPERTIIREEAATILYRLALYRKCGIHEPQNDALYLDSESISSWASVPVAAMAVYNIMNGVSEYEFSPKGIYTVEQAIATIVRLHRYPAAAAEKTEAE